MKRIKLIVPSTLIALCAGCSSTPVPVSVAVATIEGDFQKVGSIGLSAVASGDDAEKSKFKDQVVRLQCYYKKSDPIVAATVKDFTLALAGTFTDTGKASVGAITTAPAVGLEFDVAEGQTQTVTLPVTFAPLSDLPRVYFAQQVSYLTTIPSTVAAGSDIDNFRKDQLSQLVKNTNTLSQYVTSLQKSFNVDNCPTVSATPPPPVLQDYIRLQ
ncbi:hypothetical protein NCW_00674 [Burkholderia pseudomallei]